MKERIARVCLAVALVWLLLGSFVIGHAPVWFLIAAAFALAAMMLGARYIRIGGALLMVVSIVVAMIEYRAAQRMKERVREIKQQSERMHRASEASGAAKDLPR